MKVLIVGAGAMGNWFAEIVGEAATISFADIDTGASEMAATRHGGSVFDPGDPEQVDLVCIAVPMGVVTDTIATYAEYATKAIIDLSGSMRKPVKAMRAAAPTVERMSLHPLFAPANAPGNVAVVTDNAGPVTSDVSRMLDDASYRVVETTIEEHDRAMETVQAKAHAALLAYALVAEPIPPGFHTPISSGLDALLEDMLAGSPQVYADIQETFSGATSLAEAARVIAEADEDAFAELYQDATKRRQNQSDDRG